MQVEEEKKKGLVDDYKQVIRGSIYYKIVYKII